jgi:hypothetical protein
MFEGSAATPGVKIVVPQYYRLRQAETAIMREAMTGSSA